MRLIDSEASLHFALDRTCRRAWDRMFLRRTVGELIGLGTGCVWYGLHGGAAQAASLEPGALKDAVPVAGIVVELGGAEDARLVAQRRTLSSSFHNARSGPGSNLYYLSFEILAGKLHNIH
jgi:hypothetical protein